MLETVIFRSAGADEVIDLRHEVLRAGMEREAAVFASDTEPTTRHYVAELGGRVIGCVTLVQNPLGDRPAWQLRGMAVAPGHRGQGVGQRLLRLALGEVRNSPVRLTWCNARTPAVAFYRKEGWRVVSEEFHIDGAGPHFRMLAPEGDGD